ncbi:D-hexose-6-phosphate mutarotase [Ramlibacter sp. 2FC]|uniref:aldose epimerase family protein n=1 Tax=Ramlibacter sp. 2FC TaxID=2502188 RepID=UPI00201D9B05|nr:D-hexose-6-phosphate mutarotase [Ramlibacter sp. 2FC]
MLVHARLGAQVLQAQTHFGGSIFYRSPLSLGDAAPARGGVPVLFPQFAELGPLPKHGFARTSQWELTQESRSGAKHNIQYTLDLRPDQQASWPHGARLEMHAQLAPNVLCLRLMVTNIGDTLFSWTGGLHPYFAVEDLEACSVAGLSGLRVKDRYDASVVLEPEEPVRWGRQPLERLYDAAPALTLRTGRQQLELSTTGFDQWMVWNPGEAGGNALADLPDGDWRRFVCIEPVRVDRPVELAPGATFTGSLQVRTIPAEDARLT